MCVSLILCIRNLLLLMFISCILGKYVSGKVFAQVDVHPTLTDRARLVQRSARVRHKEAQPRFCEATSKEIQIKPHFYLQAILWEEVAAVSTVWLRFCSQ